MEEIQAFWQRFLDREGMPRDVPYYEAFHFDLTERTANKLLEMVLDGRKRATAGSGLAYSQESSPPPQPGDLSIVMDWNGHPRCVIRTTAVTVLPFGDMTFDICKREGEDDTLASWRNNHVAFFKAEGAVLGYEFNERMPVVFEDFEVAYREEP